MSCGYCRTAHPPIPCAGCGRDVTHFRYTNLPDRKPRCPDCNVIAAKALRHA